MSQPLKDSNGLDDSQMSVNQPTKTNSEDNDTLLPSYTDHNGFLLPKGFPVQGFITGLTYEAQPNDVFVVTYPKCGTTWMQHLVYLILTDGRPLAADERMDHIFPHLEEVGNEYCQRVPLVGGGDGRPAKRLIKTHLPYHMTPNNINNNKSNNNNNNNNTTNQNQPQPKYIFVARNPKDCVVSFFHHTRGFVQHYNFSDGSFPVFFDLFLRGAVDFGDYVATLKSWYQHKDDATVLFVTYEALRANTRDEICRVAEFLDPTVYPARLLEHDEAILTRIVRHSSLESMKKDPLRFYSDRPKEHTPFIRKGSVGGWDELLSKEQADLLDQRMRENFSDEERKFLGELY